MTADHCAERLFAEAGYFVERNYRCAKSACANIAPKIESHYWWQGQIESSSEVMIFFKTRNDKLRELEACVLKNHPYQTPEFVVLKITSGNEKYLAWIDQSVQPSQ